VLPIVKTGAFNRGNFGTTTAGPAMAAALGSFRGDGLSSAGSTPVMFARSAHTRQNVLHAGEEKSMNIMPIRHSLITTFVTLLIGISTVIASPWGAAKAQIPSLVQPWGLPPLPPGVGQVEKFADVSNTPQGQFLEGGSFDTEGNLWFVAIGSGWISYLTADGKLVPVFNCNPPPDLGQTCEPQGTRWHDGKLYLATRHRGILVYDPQSKQVSTLVYTYLGSWRSVLPHRR
jgi:hypothetical protein